MMKVALALVMFAALAPAVAAQEQKPVVQEEKEVPAANPSDVSSLDNILRAVYEAISGPAGQKRDERRFRSLFVKGARLIPTAPRKGGAGATARVFEVDEFLQAVNRNTAKMGFYEKEVSRQVQAFGNIAHVFSTYEGRHELTDAQPFVRGINSIQLLRDGGRWWVVTIYWDAERPDNPIPKEYLPKAGKSVNSKSEKRTK